MYYVEVSLVCIGVLYNIHFFETLNKVHDDILILTFHFKSVVSDSQWYILKLFLAIPSNWTIWTIGCFLLNFLFCSNISLNRCKLHAGLKSSNHILKSYICFSHTYAQNKSRVATRSQSRISNVTERNWVWFSNLNIFVTQCRRP